MQRKQLALFVWKDKSTETVKVAHVVFLNGLKMVISQDKDIQDSSNHLYYIQVFRGDGSVHDDYLDECDVYSDEPNEDYSSFMTIEQIEYYIDKLSKLLLR